MKKIILSLLLAFTACFSACGATNNTQNSSNSQKQELLYPMDDVVKPDLMWDTNTLFATDPELQECDVALGENIHTFKFRSAPYGNKENTWVFAAIGIPTS